MNGLLPFKTRNREYINDPTGKSQWGIRVSVRLSYNYCDLTTAGSVIFKDNIKHLMTGPEGNSEFCFPRISMFPETKSRETLRFEGKKFTVPQGTRH